MARLRNAVVAVVLGTGVLGCSFAHWSPFHCDDCDDFPAPSYGPDFSMMPGSYTGLPPSDSGGPARPGASTAPSGTGGSGPSAGGASQPVEEAPPPAPSPPAPPTAAPGMAAAARAS
jgi:hypothetical protein